MAKDTSLQDVFNYAKQGPLSGGDFPMRPAVYVTFVEHLGNVQTTGESTTDLVRYGNGLMTLSTDKRTLSGEFKLWRNIYVQGSGSFEGGPATPEDVFADSSTKLTIAITVSDSGQVTHLMKVNGKPIGGMGPVLLDAEYAYGLFVENSGGGSVRSLSFTLGGIQGG
jgi:hypothetical protein